MTDPKAAERARRYRARRRERDASVTSRAPVIEPVLGELERGLVEVLAELRALRAAIAELAAAGYPQLADSVGKRDVTARHAVQRDVTKRHGAESAPAPARVRTRLSGPTGPREPLEIHRDVTAAEAVLVELRRAPAPASADAIADALDVPRAAVAAALVELRQAGLVQRIPAPTLRDRDRWAPVAVESPAETIRCADYPAHRFDHRRDAASGRFRCYRCEPELEVTEVRT